MTSTTSHSVLHTKKKSSSSEEGENVLYSKSILTQKVQLPFIIVGSNIETTIKHTISTKMEGKCIVEGYVRPGSIQIINISSGTLQGRFVEFIVVFECSICCPVEGMLIKCYAKNITQAGIRAFTSLDEKKSPVIIYVSRDHHSSDAYFNSIHEKDAIRVRVIGQRFELNDKQVSIIGELLPKTYAPQRDEPVRKKIIIRPNNPSSSSSSS
jgi:DNA-directed RNA polymerase subunit E'/Rpb7